MADYDEVQGYQNMMGKNTDYSTHNETTYSADRIRSGGDANQAPHTTMSWGEYSDHNHGQGPASEDNDKGFSSK